MTAVDTILRAGRALPDLQPAHWLLRAALASFIIYQGFTKVPLSGDDAEAFGVHVLMWASAAMGEFLAGILLIAGGFTRHWIGDIITRAGGLILAAIVASVIVWVYWAPPIDIFLGNQFHLLLLVGGLYFLLRGNSA
ncbi:MAG: DoxX family protein [Pseudomonadota bacterium]